MSKNFFGKEKYISEFIHYQLKIVTHQGGYSLACRTVHKINFCRRYVLPGTLVYQEFYTRCEIIPGVYFC